jgi:competence protein ComEC
LVYIVFFCVLLGLSIGSLRVLVTKNSETFELREYYSKKITLQGKVSEYPDARSQYTYLTLNEIYINGQLFTENVLVRAPLYPEYHYGDILEVAGQLQKPKDKFGTSTNQKFSYSGYLSVNDIFSTITFPTIKKVSSADSSFIGTLYSFKDKCISVVTYYIREPAAGLLVGILFGIKRALASEVLQEFIDTGLVHIVVLSGYNIALVVEAATKLFKRAPLRLKYLLIYSSILLFTLFVGASSTVLRAGIMAAIAIFARQTGREAAGVKLLLLAAGGMVLYEPRVLMYDPSFQLGLVVWTPRALIWCRKVPQKFLLREITASTIATQLTVVPYIMWYIGSVSAIGLFANILVVPIIPLIMLGGFLTLVSGLLYLPLSFPFAVITYVLTASVLYVAHMLAQIPGVVVEASLPFYVLLIIYVLQVIYLLTSRDTEKR